VAEPPVVLFWGEDEYLLRLAAREMLEAEGVQPAEVDASEWRGGETSDLATPSLWAERRGLLVTRIQDLPDAGARELTGYVADPTPDALCVLTLVSRAKNPPPLAKAIQKAGAVLRQIAVRRQDLTRWVVGRGDRRGVRLSGPGAAALLQIVGEDPAALDQSVEQLGAAFAGKPVGPDEVRAQFHGMGEQRVWDLCDRAFGGRAGDALVVLRGLLEGREDPLLILGGIASRLRDLIRVRALPDRMPSADAARAAGLRFDWQLRRYREQAGRYSMAELTWLLDRAVDADRAIKGGTAGDVALATLVSAIAGDRGAALDVPARVGR
jgi:DNA polymerase III subunit delta